MYLRTIILGLTASVAGFAPATGRAQIVTLNAPGAGTASGQGTFAESVSGSTVAGYYIDSGGVQHGFVYNGSSYTVLNAPGAGTASGQGTNVVSVTGTYITGNSVDSNSGYHQAFSYDGTT